MKDGVDEEERKKEEREEIYLFSGMQSCRT
jgi:hypothetical protein